MVLYSRVSTRNGKQLGSLDAQRDELRLYAGSRGLIVVGEVCVSGSGSAPHRLDDAEALAMTGGAVILAHSTCRLIRAPGYGRALRRGDPSLPVPVRCDLARLPPLVAVYTVIDPDAPPEVVRGEQTRRGMARTPKTPPGGKKALRLRLAPDAVRLAAGGMSHRAVAAALGVPPSTVRRWLRLARRDGTGLAPVSGADRPSGGILEKMATTSDSDPWQAPLGTPKGIGWDTPRVPDDPWQE